MISADTEIRSVCLTGAAVAVCSLVPRLSPTLPLLIAYVSSKVTIMVKKANRENWEMRT